MELLIFVALLPAVFLMVYIYKKDGVEKEPFRVLLRIFLLGALSCIPVALAEILFEDLLVEILAEDTIFFLLVENFLGVALIEEFGKRTVVKWVAWKHKAFDYLFDGIVYCVFSAMGFAALENVVYVIEDGIGLAIARAITAVPSHATDGVLMGIFMGLAKRAENQGNRKKAKRYLRTSLLLPTITHGIYDFVLSVDSDYILFGWLIFVILTDVIACRLVKKTAQNDQRIVPAISKELIVEEKERKIGP